MLRAWVFYGLADMPQLVDMCVCFFVFLILCAWVFGCCSRQATINCHMCFVALIFCVFDCMCIDFFGVLADTQPLVAICVRFLEFFCVVDAMSMSSLI